MSSYQFILLSFIIRCASSQTDSSEVTIGAADIFSLSGDGHHLAVIMDEETRTYYNLTSNNKWEKVSTTDYALGLSLVGVTLSDDGSHIAVTNELQTAERTYQVEMANVFGNNQVNTTPLTRFVSYYRNEKYAKVSKDSRSDVGQRAIDMDTSSVQMFDMNGQAIGSARSIASEDGYVQLMVLLAEDTMITRSKLSISSSKFDEVQKDWFQQWEFFVSSNNVYDGCMAIDDGGSRFVFVNNDNEIMIKQWDDDGKAIKDMETETKIFGNSVAMNGAGSKIIVGTQTGAKIYKYVDINRDNPMNKHMKWKEIGNFPSQNTVSVDMDKSGNMVAMNGEKGGVFEASTALVPIPAPTSGPTLKPTTNDEKGDHRKLSTFQIWLVIAISVVVTVFIIIVICFCVTKNNDRATARYNRANKQSLDTEEMESEMESKSITFDHATIMDEIGREDWDGETNREFERSVVESSSGYRRSFESIPLDPKLRSSIRSSRKEMRKELRRAFNAQNGQMSPVKTLFGASSDRDAYCINCDTKRNSKRRVSV